MTDSGVPGLMGCTSVSRRRTGVAPSFFFPNDAKSGTSARPYPLTRAATVLVDLARVLIDDGIRLEHVDLGGGLGVAYDGGPSLSVADYASAVLPALRQCGLPVVLEPGRALVAQAGALVARIVDTKQFPDGRRFAVLDAGMTELMRPALYGAVHPMVALTSLGRPMEAGRSAITGPTRVDGPVCESTDRLGFADLPALTRGDLVAVGMAGAYGTAMASTYNGRPRPPEVGLDGDRLVLLRARGRLAGLP